MSADTFAKLLDQYRGQAFAVERARNMTIEVHRRSILDASQTRLLAAYEAALARGPEAALVARIVAAWEALPGGQQQSVRAVEKWLMDDMKPVIDEARAYLRGDGK